MLGETPCLGLATNKLSRSIFKFPELLHVDPNICWFLFVIGVFSVLLLDDVEDNG